MGGFHLTMKQAFVSLFVLVAATVCSAADNKPIEDVFQRYWGAFVKQEFAKAATEILPSDLEETKAAVLPVFLGAQGHKEKKVQEFVAAFFGRTVGKARENMSGADVFAALNRIMSLNDPQMFEALKQASTSIIFVRRPSEEEAQIHFQVTVQGASDTDAEALSFKNGRWWIRAKEDPKAMAEQFKAMFTQTPPPAR